MHQQYAGFWIRFVAYFIDGILLAIIDLVLSLILGDAEPFNSLLSLVIGWLYFALMESSSKQATFGKMALGLKVTDSNGERIKFGRATGRYFAKILSALILLIGFIMAGFTERKQALHDLICSTLVVKKS